MSVAHRKAAVRLWLETGYLYVKKTVSGNSIEDAAPGTARLSMPDEPIEPVAATVVNRYGSCGLEILDTIGMKLYDDAAPTTVRANVMEDHLIDPAEIERHESIEHNHLAPCSVPVTSEARAQYCMTLMELVKKGTDHDIATRCIQAMVQMPVGDM